MKYILNDYNSAINDFTKAIKYDENNISAYFNRGLCFKELRQYEQALVDFKFARKIDSTNPEIDKEIKNVTSYINREFIPIKLDMIQFDKNEALDIFKRAKIKAENNSLIEALKDFDLAVSLEPNNAEFYYERGVCRFHLNNFNDALIDFEQSIKRGNSQANYMFQRCKDEILKNKSDIEKAIDLFSEKKWREAILELSKIIEPFENESPESIVLIDGIVYPKKEIFDAFYYRGYARLQSNDFANAIIDFDNVISCNENMGDVLNWRGLAKLELKDYNSAIVDFTKAIRINPDLPYVNIRRGICFIKLGKKTDAKDDFQIALDKGESEAQDWIKNYF
jgi:tetratricopeptide (TPR) repeat protein